MSIDWMARKREDTTRNFQRSIVFQERSGQKVYDASTDEDLSKSCLLVLRERYENPDWKYLPSQKDLTEEEKEFLDYYKTDYLLLPILLQRMAESVKRRIEARVDVSSDPDWVWYTKVENLLRMPPDQAIDYKIPYKGRWIPTSYYLLIQRRNNPNEGFVLVDRS